MADRSRQLAKKEDKEYWQRVREKDKRQKNEVDQMNKHLQPFITRFLNLFEKVKKSFLVELIEAIKSDMAYRKLSPEEQKELRKNAEKEEMQKISREQEEVKHEGPKVVAEKKRILSDKNLTDKEKIAGLAQLCDISGKFITVKFKKIDAILRFQPMPGHGVEIYWSPIEKTKDGKEYLAELEVAGGVNLEKDHKIRTVNLDDVMKTIKRYGGLDKDFNELNIRVLGYDQNPDQELNQEDKRSLEARALEDEVEQMEMEENIQDGQELMDPFNAIGVDENGEPLITPDDLVLQSNLDQQNQQMEDFAQAVKQVDLNEESQEISEIAIPELITNENQDIDPEIENIERSYEVQDKLDAEIAGACEEAEQKYPAKKQKHEKSRSR